MADKVLKMPIPFSLEEELKVNPKLKMSDVEMLREWCEKQRHLPKVPDVLLVLFLHSNYYSMEAAKATAENFFTMRTHIPEFFSDRDPLGSKQLRQAFDITAPLTLSGQSKKGYKIFYVRLANPDPTNYVFYDSCKYCFMAGDLYLMKMGTMEGASFIGDAADLSLTHAGRISLIGLKKLIAYIQEALPVRLKEVHFINAPPALEMILNMAKPFIKKELLELIRVHSSLKSLEQYMSLDLLPNECGGKAGPVKKLRDEQVKELEDFREWFLEEQRVLRVDESLRIGKSKTAGDLFGVEGSFKKLDID